MRCQLPISTLHDILNAVSEGDEKSFRKLFHLYKQDIYAYAMHFTHSETASEEIVQDIFMKLWLHKETLGAITSFPAYLYTITRNRCFDHLKKLSHEQSLKQELIREAGVSGENPETTVIYNNYNHLIQEALKLLPPQQKKIYTLSFYHGRKQEEIAQSLHISRNTVKVHLSKARAAVRNYLAAYLDTVIFLIMMLFLKGRL